MVVTSTGASCRSPSTSGALARTAGAFMRIINTGPEDDRLVGLDSDIAARAETHTTIETGDGIMQMRRVEDGFVIPAGGEHLLARGGDHLMFMGLKRRLQDGDLVTVTLHFEKAGDVTIQIPVDLGRDRDMQMQGMTMPEGEDS